ncbi:MAG: NAD(+) synthase [Chloroflexi bacterium]|nr:NAD(+) synthase [Chloroflexota bacterium]
MTPTNTLFSRSALGMVRVAAVSPELRVADVGFNVRATLAALDKLSERKCQIAVLPELGLTGYTCGDLFYQSHLLDQARAQLAQIAEHTERTGIVCIVGLPLELDGRLYNCAAVLGQGRVIGVVPKTYLPTSGEYYEERWFSSARHTTKDTVVLAGSSVPFGADLLFTADNVQNCVLGVEICEDLWAVSPPSGAMALAGATILANPSASVELLGKSDYRRDLVKQQSARCLAAYIYAGAGPSESTTDFVCGGHSLIAENASLLAETERFHFTTQSTIADIDLQRLSHERLNSSSYSSDNGTGHFRRVRFTLPRADEPMTDAELLRPVAQTPFVPTDTAQRARHSQEIFNIQSTGLARRLMHTGAKRVTIGISGGLDSTLALLVVIRAFDIVGLVHDGIIAITMPGFGTTSRTRTNAERLADLLGVTLRRIPIVDAVRQHFADIGHSESVHDVTYENAQARERTQILMDIANQTGGFTVGTGDLSELALGWATFNGDQMSMYHVNAGVPKTLVRYLIEWVADSEFSGEVSAVLRDICDTPITPELLPLGDGDKLQQETETTIGPYLLHDFFLYQVVRYGYPPRKVFYLARHAFGGMYAPDVVLHWLELFYRRFFSQQYKRSAMPDSPKVGTVALSPRGDWRMPSDASSSLWQIEIDDIRQSLNLK